MIIDSFLASFSPLENRADFDTHLKYISLLARIGRGLSVMCLIAPTLPIESIPKTNDKMRLIDMTKKSIKDEYDIVQMDDEYSTAAVLWLPIKSYYANYHLLCVVDCLLSGKLSILRAKHGDCVEHFTKMLSDGLLIFSQPLFNQVFDKNILDFTTASGEHLRRSVSDDILYKLIMKKVASEKITSWKFTNGITEIRTLKNRQRVERFKQSMTVSIFDFFYQMRLRLNYRNFNFIDNIPANLTKRYFEEYFCIAEHFFDCFMKLRKKLIDDITARSLF